MIFGVIVIAVGLLLAFAMHGRTGHPGLNKFYGWAYAHRGLHGNGVPENSLKAFQLAKDKGYGAELDVHLMADGNLAVIHDSSLKRTTQREGQIENLTCEQLGDYYLEGTSQTIPLLQDVLKLMDGQVPLIIELKSQVDNYKALCEKTCQLLDGYTGAYCLESFDPRCIIWLKKRRPDIIRGQLAENYFKTKGSKVPFVLKVVLTNHLMNFLSKPDFIAYRYSDRKRFVNRICRKLWGLTGVTWTVDSKEVFDAVKEESWIPIFEGFEP